MAFRLPTALRTALNATFGHPHLPTERAGDEEALVSREVIERLVGRRVGDVRLYEQALRHRSMLRGQPGAYLAAPYPPAYTLVGLRLGGTVDWAGAPLRVQLGIQNLFDVRYRDALGRFRYFVDEPGRNVTLRVAVPLG